jgi:prepilin-type N-terminal cleavage/methylation domain-containing protein
VSTKKQTGRISKMLSKLHDYKHREKGSAGFTLIELLVVILIIGILSAIVVVAVRGNTSGATAKACTQNAANLMSALDRYSAEHNDTFPTTTGTTSAASVIAALPAGANNKGATLAAPYAAAVVYSTAELTTALVPNYIKTVPSGNVYAIVDSAAVPANSAVLCTAPNGINAGL